MIYPNSCAFLEKRAQSAGIQSLCGISLSLAPCSLQVVPLPLKVLSLALGLEVTVPVRSSSTQDLCTVEPRGSQQAFLGMCRLEGWAHAIPTRARPQPHRGPDMGLGLQKLLP